jgi:hypothetical protein
MTAATIHPTAIPSTLGAWDRMVGLAREQRLDNGPAPGRARRGGRAAG